jgi:bifunctional non-homologous end joining protein LigD
LIHLMDPPAAPGATNTSRARSTPENGETAGKPSSSGLSSSSAEPMGGAWVLADLPSVEPMLATASSESEVTGDDWHYEVKWDGYRGIASVAGGELLVGSRRGVDFTATYPELGELVGLVGAHAAVLDGEIVALGPDGRSHFELLQNHSKGAAPAHYMAFDLLWLDGKSLMGRPYLERRAALEGLLGEGGRFVHVPTTFGDDRELALTASAQLALEGLIAKRPSGTYAPGRRSRTWLKIKNVRELDVVVVGWSPGERGRSGTIGSLLLAVAEPGGLVYVGRAGSGFTERGLAEALTLLAPLERPDAPVEGVPAADARGVHWVEPRLAGRVSYGDRTSADLLRHPVWRGWRPGS